MQVLVPINITPGMLTSSSVPEPDTGDGMAWSASTAYQPNDVVFVPSTHRRYRAAVANTNRNPATDTATPAAWVDIGATNRWTMFDDQISTQTITGSPLTVTLSPGAFNAVSLFGLLGDTLTVTVRDAPGGNVIFERNQSLEDSAPADYYEHFFSPYSPQTNVVITDIPVYINPEITLTVSADNGNVAVGAMILGDLRTLGCTMYGATAKFVDYSYISIDAFGNNKIQKRKSAKDLVATALFDTSMANLVVDTCQELLGVPCVWIPSTEPKYAGLRAYGLGNVEVTYEGPTISRANLNVKGLV